MSPLWGFKVFVYSLFYKHAAPLGLKDSLSRFLVIPLSRFPLFSLKLWLSLLHERPPALLIILAGEASLH